MMLLALLLAAAAGAETPKAYHGATLRQLRATRTSARSTHPERYFAPQLMAAIKEDARLAHGEVGYVDGDPICQCQDPDGLHASVTTRDAERPRQSDRPRRDRLAPATSRAPPHTPWSGPLPAGASPTSAADEQSLLHDLEEPTGRPEGDDLAASIIARIVPERPLGRLGGLDDRRPQPIRPLRASLPRACARAGRGSACGSGSPWA